MNPLLFLGSLVAVLATAGIVAWLRLGEGGKLDDPARLAEDLLPDFEADEVFADAHGKAALVRGRDGSWALLRLQGLHPVVRRFAARPALRDEGGTVRIASGERRFGDVTIANDRLLTLL